MNKLFGRIAVVLSGMTMAISVGAVVGQQTKAKMAKADAEPFYSLVTTSPTGTNASPHNSYTAAATVTIDEVGWSVKANSYMTPWRIGGKNTTNTNRELYTTTAINSSVNKITFKYSGVTAGSKTNVTFNSITLNIYSDSERTVLVDSCSKDTSSTLTITNSGSATSISGGTLDFTPTAPKTSWAKDSYYEFLINYVTAKNGGSDTANSYISFTGLDFYAPQVAVSGVTLNKTSASIGVGGTETLTATVSPADATDKSVTWTSSDETVATVDGGVVSALKAGSTTITVTTTDGSFTATCDVTVTPYVGRTYNKVSSAPADWRGTYLFVYEAGSLALNGASASISSAGNGISVTIKTNSITANSSAIDNAVFTIVRDSDGNYRVMRGTKYLTGGSGALSLNDSKSANNLATIGVDALQGGSYTLKYNTSWGGFRYYSSGQKTVSLYKMAYDNSSAELTSFVNSFDSATSTICASYATNTASSFSSVWGNSSSGLFKAFKDLSADAQGVLANQTYTHGSEESGSRADIVDRYDYIVSKYSTLADFMNRKGLTGVYQNNHSAFQVDGFSTQISEEGPSASVMVIILATSMVCGFGLFAIVRKRRQADE